MSSWDNTTTTLLRGGNSARLPPSSARRNVRCARTLTIAASTKGWSERRAPGEQTRRWSLGPDADHTHRSRCAESLRARSCFALPCRAPTAAGGRNCRRAGTNRCPHPATLFPALRRRPRQVRSAMRPARSVSSKAGPQAVRSAAALFRPCRADHLVDQAIGRRPSKIPKPPRLS